MFEESDIIPAPTEDYVSQPALCQFKSKSNLHEVCQFFDCYTSAEDPELSVAEISYLL